MLLIKGDLDHAMKCCRSACLILGDLNDVRAMESCSLLIGDCYVLQGRPWPSLTEYAQVLDSARLRSVSFFFFFFLFSFFLFFFRSFFVTLIDFWKSFFVDSCFFLFSIFCFFLHFF